MSFEIEQLRGATRLAMMIAVMDDPWVEKWAVSFGVTRKPKFAEWDTEETMSEFRARIIETMGAEVQRIDAETDLMQGHEVDIVTGERVE